MSVRLMKKVLKEAEAEAEARQQKLSSGDESESPPHVSSINPFDLLNDEHDQV